MVKPPDILLERDCTNDDVVEACSYGALNLKPEKPRPKSWTMITKSFWATHATYQRDAGWQTLAKQRSQAYLFRNWDAIGINLAPFCPMIFEHTDERISNTSVENLQQTVISTLHLSDEGARTPKLVTS